LKSAISANNFKLDDAYKNKVDQSTQGMEQSVKAGMKLVKRKKEDCGEQPTEVSKELNSVVSETLTGLKRMRVERANEDIDDFL